MKKFVKFLSFALAVIFVLSLTLVSASAASVRLDDSANLLTDSEEEKLLAKLDSESEALDFDIVIVTVKGIGLATIRQYADSYYDTHGFRNDGIVLVINMGTREYYESTTGFAKNIWSSDWDFEKLEATYLAALKSGNYYSAFSTFVSKVSKEVKGHYSDNGIDISSGNPDSYANYSESQRLWIRIRDILLSSLLITVIVSLIAALIMTAAERRKLTSVRFQKNAGMYLRKGSFALTKSHDIFLYRTESRVKINNSSNSGGGHGGRGGGGGGSHGGHGGHF